MQTIEQVFTNLNDNTDKKKLVSIVLPVFNEEECLPNVLRSLSDYLGTHQQKYNWEIIFIDDCSTDNSFSIIANFAANTSSNVNMAVFRLSKNSGSHVAITSGLNISRASFTIVMASDGQDPPEVIEQLLTEWNKGEKIILAAREDNLDHSFVGKLFSNMAWKFMNWATGIEMPEGGCDMLGIDRLPLHSFNRMNERNTTFIYRLLSVGFAPKTLYYTKRERIAGKSKWTFIKKLRIMLDAVTGYSSRPLRLITRFSLLIFIILIIRWGSVIFFLFYNGEEPSDRTVILNSIFTSLAIIILILSALGDYIWRILDETRKRPVYDFSKADGKIMNVKDQ